MQKSNKAIEGSKRRGSETGLSHLFTLDGAKRAEVEAALLSECQIRAGGKDAKGMIGEHIGMSHDPDPMKTALFAECMKRRLEHTETK